MNTADTSDEAAIEGTPWPLVHLTSDGLRYWLDCAVEPTPPATVDVALRPDAEALEGAGLISSSGEVPDDARAAVSVVREPTCTLDVEAAVGAAARHFRAWVGADCAVIFATDPPWSGVDPTAAATAGFSTPPSARREVRIVDPEWVPVALARWALITPRQVREPAQLTVAQDVFQRRLVDYAVPAPDGAPERLTDLWAEPLYTWGVGIEPTGDRLLILDAGNAGHRVVTTSGGTVTLHAVPSLTLWHNVIAMIDRAFARGD